MSFKADRPRVARVEMVTADIEMRVCEHELATALADLAGVDRRTAEIPESIQEYAGALAARLRLFPQCPHKVTA